MRAGDGKRCDGCGVDSVPLEALENNEYCPSCLKVRQQSDLAVREAFESAFAGVIAAARSQGISNADIIGIVARECAAGKAEMELIDGEQLERLAATTARR